MNLNAAIFLTDATRIPSEGIGSYLINHDIKGWTLAEWNGKHWLRPDGTIIVNVKLIFEAHKFPVDVTV